MKFPYFSDEDIDKANQLIEPGEVEFTIKSVENAKSKAGNDQLIVDISLKDSRGSCISLKDYIPFTINMAWKLKQFLESIGFEYSENKDYDLNTFYRKKGTCIILIKKEKYNDQIFDRIKIVKYIKSDSFINDDVPF
jgi:hypothetical protein